MEGWIKLHRKILDSNVFNNEKLLKIWVWCLVKATHQEYKQLVGQQIVELKPGQFIFGRNVASAELNMNSNTFYKNIKLLEKCKNISIKSNNKYSIVTIENWGLYQTEDNSSNNKITTKEQQNNNKITQTKTIEHKNIYLFNNNKENDFDVYDSDPYFQKYLKTKGINNRQEYYSLSNEEQENLSESFVLRG